MLASLLTGAIDDAAHDGERHVLDAVVLAAPLRRFPRTCSWMGTRQFLEKLLVVRPRRGTPSPLA